MVKFSILILRVHLILQNPVTLKETGNSYFGVTPKNQALHKSTSLFLKQLKTY